MPAAARSTVRLLGSRRPWPAAPRWGTGARRPRRPSVDRGGSRGDQARCGGGLGWRRWHARRDAVPPRSPLRGPRTALPALARRDRLLRPEARDRMTWFLRRAGVDDLPAIMRIESSTFASDAWSESVMA